MNAAALLEASTPVRSYTLRSAEFLLDPYPTYARLRRDHPVYWSEEMRGWILTGYEDVKQGMDMSVDFVRPFARRYLERRGDDADVRDLGDLVGGWMSFFDVPQHTRLRNLLNQVVNRNSVEAIRPRIVEIAQDLLTDLQGQPTVDIAARFSNRLPVIVIGELLGIDTVEECDQLMQWSDELHLFVGQSQWAQQRYARAAQAAREMDRYFRELVATRRRAPRNDGITRMIHATDDGERLSDDELAANCAMLFYAGHETTAGQISLSLMALARHPDQLQRLRSQRDTLMVQACEEMLRYDGPVQAMVRVAAQDCRIRDTAIRAGDRIYPFINAANRDPEIFPHADRLDIDRQSNRHIVFGHGVHFCIGSWLARAELPIALTAFLDHVDDFQIPHGARIEMRDSLAFRAPTALPLNLHWAS